MKIYELTSGVHLDEEWQETNYLSERGRTNFLMWIMNDRAKALLYNSPDDCEIVVTDGNSETNFPILINDQDFLGDFLESMEEFKTATIILKSYGEDWETYHLEEIELDDWDA